jgi:SecD/SecF fusion protein
MRNKGLVIVFATILGLISLYQLSFTFKSNQIRNEAKTFANGDYNKEKQYLDSLAKKPVFSILGSDFTYDDLKDREMNLGLDLRGGINVILQVSVKDILKSLANHSDNIVFNQALDEASKMQKSSNQPYVELFFEAFDKINSQSDKPVKLSSPEIFGNRNLSDEITFNMPDNEVKKIITKKVDDAMVSAFEVLRKRIDKFGVTQPNIQRLGKSGRILVELAGAKDIERVKKLLQSTAQLEFWHAYNSEDVIPYLEKLNKYFAQKEVKQDTLSKDADSLLVNNEQKESLFKYLAPGRFSRVGVVKVKDMAKVEKMLNDPEAKKMLPAELKNIKFLWGKPEKKGDIVYLYAIKGNRENIPPIGGDVIVDAQSSFDQFGNPAVTMQMNGTGAKKWKEMTTQAFNDKTGIAIVLDNIVYSAPGVSSGPITGGRSEITGNFTVEEAKDLANVLRAGKLPAKADIVQSEIVGPSLGKKAIDGGKMSFAIALFLIFLWMFGYYGKAGLFSDVALILNILFIFGILASLNAVLTLPGIAGIVLTIGMAVDANVLIFERVREELRRGKNLRSAVDDGFKNALSSILDANITTALTGAILLLFGTGPIQGFATTLLIGIFTSLFTAIFITRYLVEWYLAKGKNLTFDTNISKNLFANVKYDFLSKRKLAYTVSGIIIAIGLFSIFTNGLNPGVDFVGGRTYIVAFDKNVNPEEVKASLTEQFVDDKGNKFTPDVKNYGGNNQLKITTKFEIDNEGEEADNDVQERLFKGLQSYFPNGYTYKDFISSEDNKKIGRMQSIKVGPTIADDIKKGAVYAVFGSLFVVFMYILLRFKKWQFSAGAVIAVFHDVLVVLGIFSLMWRFAPFNMEIDQSFIAAILTVIGYSLNDTVVIFDRIREFMKEHHTWALNKKINQALDSTLSRTLNTSLTTLITLIAIFIFGGESIRGFVFALIIGVIVGTYSSLFIATPVMYDLSKDEDAKK